MNHAAVGEAWTSLRGDLLRFIRRRVAAEEEAEDLLHEVFLRAQARVGQLRDPAKLQGWLFQIARTVVVDRHRSRHDLAPLEAEPVAEEPDDPDLGSQALALFALAVVDELPEPYRTALRLTTVEGLTQREAAERAGVSLSGMKSRVQRGRAMVRERIDACCAVELDVRKHPMTVRPRGVCEC